MSYSTLKSLAVVIPTITGRKDEFKRCMESLKLAEDLAPRDLEIRYFISLDTSREQLLKDNIEEICKCDMVTFVDDDDYVGRSFFSLPKLYDDSKIYQIKSLTMKLDKYPYCKSEEVVWYNVLIGGENGKAYNHYWDDNSFELYDCHLWGYFYPSKIIGELTKDLLIPRPEVTGPWEDVCYWAWIITNYGNNLRKLNSSIYFHISLNRRSLIHKLTKEIKLEKLDIVKAINKDLETKYLVNSGYGIHFREIWDFGPYQSPLKEFIDLFELREHRLTKKEKSKFRKLCQSEFWNEVDKEEFLELLK